MFQRIAEKIEVAGVYKNTEFIPRKFQWRHRVYQIDELTLISDIKDGGIRKRLYSVTSRGNLYRLCFNRDSESWLLEEVWYE